MKKIKIITRTKNFFLCLRYPFLKPRNVWTGKFVGKYSFTNYDLIPEGWRIAFGKQLIKDLRKQLKKDKYLKKYFITDIKEKYGTLRIYDFGATQEVHNIINKYEKLSEEFCINCGKLTEFVTLGWINYLCHTCALDISPEHKKRIGED